MLNAADPDNGKALFIGCSACHNTAKGQPSKGVSMNRFFIGPSLEGIVGRKIASRKDYKYSEALLKHKDKVWTTAELSKWIKSPARYAPGTKMNFSGLLDPQDRMDMIAYLMTLK